MPLKIGLKKIDGLNTKTIIQSANLPELDNPATAADILEGQEAINASGTKMVGTIERKSSSDLTVDEATITVPSGYYSSQVSKSVTTAAQAIPSVSIDANGKITASATQTAGYVSEGTKSSDKQLPVQGAKTITPAKSAQTAIASGVYTTGTVTVDPIPDEYVELPELTNPAEAAEVFENKEYIDATGAKKTGTFTITHELDTLDTLLATLETSLEGKATSSVNITFANYSVIDDGNGNITITK